MSEDWIEKSLKEEYGYKWNLLSNEEKMLVKICFCKNLYGAFQYLYKQNFTNKIEMIII